MRISVSRSKNAASYYIVDSFRDLSGKVKTKIVQKLGTEESIRAEHGDVDPMIWAKEKLLGITFLIQSQPNKAIVFLPAK